ncbi:IucA/IucC family protein [Nonomuraea sp. NPDC059023]|uniref:IucA/IucC family protein n=1 Tax=unclassified Nonomuraea TaxID=2593643 RepID=UPI0036C965F5
MESLVLDSPAASPPRAEEATLAALLRCCVREVAGPRGLVWPAPPYLLLRVGGTLLRARTRGGAALRFTGPPERLEQGVWVPLTTDELVRRAVSDLSLGEVNAEFAGQVAASREALEAILSARAGAVAPADPWLASEQALVYGHPFHPSPKARGGRDWLAYAPEAHARFPVRLLGVRSDVVAQEGVTGVLDRLGEAPPGYALLPAHPWQLDLLGPVFDDRLVDLGPGPVVVPTSSVRTVYAPDLGVCLKFSLDVRITNCVRKNAWYELAGAVELNRRLGTIFDEISGKYPATRWLPEPGYRSAGLGTRLLEGLGVIVRSSPWSVVSPGVTPVLAGALATEGVRTPDPAAWWRAYVAALVPPVLELYFRHGVVLEPHLQNVLVGLDADGLPAEVVFRDLEGTKLVTGRHDLTGVPDRVAEALSYDAERGWARVAYCLLVNHLTEIAASVAPDDATLTRLWRSAAEVIARVAADLGNPVPLSDLLAGAPLPAKANLSVRWARAADRAAGYVPIANPLA